jgi:hypothetical protein
VSRRFRDTIFTALALVVLFATLVSINPRLRERSAQMLGEPGLDMMQGMVTRAMMSSVSFVHGYADENSYLFSFLIAAVIFAVMMMKVIR